MRGSPTCIGSDKGVSEGAVTVAVPLIGGRITYFLASCQLSVVSSRADAKALEGLPSLGLSFFAALRMTKGSWHSKVAIVLSPEVSQIRSIMSTTDAGNYQPTTNNQ